MADAAAVVFGPVGGTMISAGILVSVLGVNAGSALVAPRCLYALSHEGMIPSFLGRVHPLTRTPVAAILVTSALTLTLALSGSFVVLAVLSMGARRLQYIATCGAMIRFRVTRPDEPPPFRAPAGLLVALLAIALCGWLLVESDPAHLAWSGVAIVAGLLLHLPTRRKA